MHVRNVIVAVSVTIAALLGVASSAQAQVLAVTTMEGTYEQRVNDSWQPIFVNAGGTTLQFTTTKDNERIVITYSASCLALSFVVMVRANIDGVIASPGVTSGVSLCGVPAVQASTYPASRTFSALIAKKGVHKITIEVMGSGAAIMIGDSALVVQH